MVTTTRGTNGKSAEVMESLNPATGEILGTVPVAGGDEVASAVARAREASRTWGAMSRADRREQLVAFRRALAGRADEMAELIHRENGKPRLDALLETMSALGHVHHAALRAEKALRPHKVSSGLMANFRSTISDRTVAAAAARSSTITTPLPAARPSAFKTSGYPNRSPSSHARAALADSHT